MSKTTNKFASEVRERAVRMVFDHERDHPSRWAAVVSIAEKIGCAPQTLHEWVKKAEINGGKRAGVPTEVADKVKVLEREVRELRQAKAASSIVAIGARNTRPPSTPSASLKPGSSRRSAAATTTLWPRRSMASTRPRSSTGVDPGDHSKRWNTRPSSGSTG